mgnify:CR=1 FL=1
MKRVGLIVLLLLVVAAVAVAGVAFTVSWDGGGPGLRAEIQTATTPTSTWKTLVVAPAETNSFASSIDNNNFTRGRFYYMRARWHFDNGTLGIWSPYVGVAWLTGPFPADGVFLKSRTDNSVVKVMLPAPAGGM